MKAAVVGAGIVGSAIARELTRYEQLDVQVLEKEADVGWGASKANTGILHAGYDDDPERYPLRAKLCRMGNSLWRELSMELQVHVKWCGALVLALDERDSRILTELLSRGRKNGVPGLEIKGRNDCLKVEKNLSERVLEGLWAPTIGVISPYKATIALMENAEENGAKLHLETLVQRIVVGHGEVLGVETDRGLVKADIIINASGIFGDLLSRTAGVNDFSIRPRRGEYILFDREVKPSVEVTLFRAPQPTTKGVVVTQTAEGNLLIGPNAEDLTEEERDDTNTTRNGLNEVWSEASKLVSRLPPREKSMRTFAGLRPEPDGGDFIIQSYDNPFGLINSVGMRSPGLTSAPATALEAVKLLKELGVNLTTKRDWKAKRKAMVSFRELTPSGRDHLISQDPSYGKVVCNCEVVTEAEVRDAIRRGAVTLDSIKFRTRAGMGRCQGSSCLARLLTLLSEETGKPMNKITLKGRDSFLVKSPLRGG